MLDLDDWQWDTHTVCVHGCVQESSFVLRVLECGICLSTHTHRHTQTRTHTHVHVRTHTHLLQLGC